LETLTFNPDPRLRPQFATNVISGIQVGIMNKNSNCATLKPFRGEYMKDELNEIGRTLDRVRIAGYPLPALERLLEDLNDRLTTITNLDPLTELPAAGLSVADWLTAVELRRSILVELIEVDV
jgi:hypothetical protein